MASTKHFIKENFVVIFCVLYLVFAVSVLKGYKENVYVKFDMEGYDTIVKDYWMPPSAYDLPRMFQLALSKATGHAAQLGADNEMSTEAMLDAAMMATSSPDAQRQIAVDTLQLVLVNLAPFDRNYIDSSQQVTALRQEVSNINPSVDLYANLGVSASSSASVIQKAYKQKMAMLKNSTSSADQLLLQQATYADKVLSNPGTKFLYDTEEVQPTVFSRIIGDTMYIYIKEMSPTAPQEFAWAVDAASSTPSVDTMIIDLRGNIGGALDVARGMSGMFLGNDLNVFDLYHQGHYEATSSIFFWKQDELDKYKQIAVLTDSLTQSTAELFTEIMQSGKTAYVVGSTTRGWGTVENTYPLRTVIDSKTNFTLYLVNSLTMRNDGQPIQGNGITPDVDVSQAGWQNKLTSFFTSTSLINAIESTIAQPPQD